MPRKTTRRKTTRKKLYKKAEIGRFDGEYKTVAFKEGDTVQALLDKAGLYLGSGEEINNDSGTVVKGTEKAKDDETYHLTGNFKNGN